jgi:hypothetical protein
VVVVVVDVVVVVEVVEVGEVVVVLVVDVRVGCGPGVVVLMTGAVVTGAASRDEPHAPASSARAPTTTR